MRFFVSVALAVLGAHASKPIQRYNQCATLGAEIQQDSRATAATLAAVSAVSEIVQKLKNPDGFSECDLSHCLFGLDAVVKSLSDPGAEKDMEELVALMVKQPAVRCDVFGDKTDLVTAKAALDQSSREPPVVEYTPRRREVGSVGMSAEESRAKEECIVALRNIKGFLSELDPVASALEEVAAGFERQHASFSECDKMRCDLAYGVAYNRYKNQQVEAQLHVMALKTAAKGNCRKTEDLIAANSYEPWAVLSSLGIVNARGGCIAALDRVKKGASKAYADRLRTFGVTIPLTADGSGADMNECDFERCVLATRVAHATPSDYNDVMNAIHWLTSITDCDRRVAELVAQSNVDGAAVVGKLKP